MAQQATAQIGVTGLAVMGRNLARNLARNGFTVAVHNRSPERTRSLVAEHGDEGTFVPRESMADFVASLERPRAVIVMVKAGGPTDAVIDELVPLLERGRHRRRLRQRALRRHPPPGGGAARRTGCTSSAPASPAARRARCSARASCRAAPPSPTQKLGPMFEKIAAQVDGDAVLPAHRPGRRRALREDGAQRHRVRRHAAHRRGVRPAAGRPGGDARRRSRRSSGSGTPASWSRS